MAKKKSSSRRGYSQAKRRGFSRKPTISIAVVAGLSVPMVRTYNNYKSSGLQNALGTFAASMTGYNPDTGVFHAASMKLGLLPVMVGASIHKFASMIGLNRAIAGAGIPFIRI